VESPDFEGGIRGLFFFPILWSRVGGLMIIHKRNEPNLA
jgi:hypothetical protein